ncbi:ADP-ribosylglycohydrolase family protein [Clostridium malenominatum]|uniref:ADP-ribosylglycohydrolase family protein n=1 Tax=Clostridium malenominatum TaxID=1539 RepID=A0ABN1ITN7_9CLOT
MIPIDYLQKVYAGFLGMNVGIRLGACVEPSSWTYERIKLMYGDIKGYVKDYKNFAADDDANGPVFFIRALYDDAIHRELTPEDVGRAWLNYTREGIGMFWWGGEGVSTEHTAFLNLKKGIKAPQSGSIEENGIVLAEQIGGQIFIDTWGLLFPSSIEKAAKYAEVAASVSHDKNGLYGARFISACISKAFSAKNIEEIIEVGLSVIPKDSTYAQVVNGVLNFYKESPEDFASCRKYLEDYWGYDRYPGICHIIPNAGVCVLALIYGQGNFARTVEIATMCGWDTDCNAGNVGTILGVFNGIEGIEEHYRGPINDFIVASSVSGYLNIIDIPTFSKELALLGYRLSNNEAPKDLIDSYKEGELYFDFELAGTTHGFRVSNGFKTRIRHSYEKGYNSKGSLEVLFDRMVENDSSKIFYKPFYRRSDFEDERYKPTLATKAYSGQKVSLEVFLDKWEGEDMIVTPYVRNTFNQEEILLKKHVLENNLWQHIEFIIPDVDGALIDEVGIILESPSKLANRALGRLFIDNFHVSGKSKYTIDFSKQAIEFLCVTPFSHNRGEWSIEDKAMKCISKDGTSAYTGNYYSKDISLKAEIKPLKGYEHSLIVRGKGIYRNYSAGFYREDKVAIILNDFEYKILSSTEFKWEFGRGYDFQVEAIGDNITLYIDGSKILEAKDDSIENGMIGFACGKEGESILYYFEVEEK